MKGKIMKKLLLTTAIALVTLPSLAQDVTSLVLAECY